MEHVFTTNIKNILSKHFGEDSDDAFEKSLLIQYLNSKTASANKGSKARSSFANLYAIYVIIEDYLTKGFDNKDSYSKYEGAVFSDLFQRQRELPFGSKLQNHALNNRMNAEFQKFFPTSDSVPIVRDLQTNRYWINENLLKIKTKQQTINLAKSIIEIIDEYVKTKQDAFQRFIQQCEELQQISKNETQKIHDFIIELLAPNADARLFEIVSYSILKYYYQEQNIIWGFDMDNLNTESLKLYKTGRTNANDGGIDFVMKPLGRFFQVTETLDFKKYFLDIEKIEKYPMTFVVKSDEEIDSLRDKLKANALKIYTIERIVQKYMDCIEEIINIPKLRTCFLEVEKQGQLADILNEIILQSKVEFNYLDEEDEEE